jgi:hypothetical protein
LVPNTDREDKFGAVEWVLAFDGVLGKIEGYAGNKVWMQPKELTKLVLTKWDFRRCRVRMNNLS